MPSNTPMLPALRGYAPFGELDVNQERQRSALMLEIPMWEGSDRAMLRSIRYPGASAQWIRPTHIAAGPSWTWNPNAGNMGFPKSGHNAIQVWARNGKTVGGQGYRYADIWDSDQAILMGVGWSVLAVGAPMAFMNRDLSPVNRGNSFRVLWSFVNGAGNSRHALDFAYDQETIRARFNTNSSFATNALPYYGQRTSFLYTQGITGSGGFPRIFLGREDGVVKRSPFNGLPTGGMWDAVHLNLFEPENLVQEGATAGGCWEYFAFYNRTFDDDEAVAISRDALASVKWDPYVSRRTGLRRRLAQVIAEASVYPRVSARGSSSARVLGETSNYPRVSGSAHQTGARVTAETDNFPRVSARIRIADREADMQATPLCPSEMGWLMDNVLELTDVQDDMQEPPADITSANSVTVEIWDRDTDQELTVSPVTLSQVGLTNTWRESVFSDASNGFAENQRLVLIFIFDGGPGLQGRFYAYAVVPKKAG